MGEGLGELGSLEDRNYMLRRCSVDGILDVSLSLVATTTIEMD